MISDRICGNERALRRAGEVACEDREIELDLTVELNEGTPSSRETVLDRVQRMEKLLASLTGQLAILKTELVDNE